MPATSGFRPWLADHKWPLGYVAVIVFLFLLYQAILPNLIDEVSTPVTAWLPVATINECLMWAIMALGLNVVVGYAGLLDLGYVAFWALGGYTAGWLMAAPFNWTWDFQLFAPVAESYPGTHITFWLVILIAGCLCALLGVAIGAPTLRLRGDYLALVTLGFGEVITQFFRNSNDIDGYNVANGDAGIPIIDPIGLGPFGLIAGVPESLTNSGSDNIYKILVLGGLLGLCLFVSLRIRGGRLGRAWQPFAKTSWQRPRWEFRWSARSSSRTPWAPSSGALAAWRMQQASPERYPRQASTSASLSLSCSWSCSAAWAMCGA